MNPSRKQLAVSYPTLVYAFASPVYWPEDEERKQAFADLQQEMSAGCTVPLTVHTVDSAAQAEALAQADKNTPCVVVALSGGVQPWMDQVCRSRTHIGVWNAYLSTFSQPDFAHHLMHRNAHPSSTDFYAACRIAGKSVTWLASLQDVESYAVAWQAACRLKAARFLKIGETEPWVINSCRDPEIIAERIGCEVIPLEREDLYKVVATVTDEEAQPEAESWKIGSRQLVDVGVPDLLKASKVSQGMRRILESHQADGLSMACFAMIGDIDTTSCLALSALNDSAYDIGACEGDLDAMLTLFLLKAMGSSFVWIGNPVIHADNWVDLVHCTAPVCACGRALPYRLMRHHESGKGVAPEVELPDHETASAVRLSVNTREVVCHVGTTRRRDKLPACHTQIGLKVHSSQQVLDTLLGTHLVLGYGDFGKRMALAAGFLGFTPSITTLRT
jgi:L-fucose isomerase-like protein